MADVKLLRPQRLTDNPDGGGLATNTEVIDGQVNNLFDDISRIDRVNGELSLRKAFIIAATDDTALYSDVHVIVQTPPQDPRVSTVIFETSGWSDVRDDARNQLERYLDPSVPSRMIPYDLQLAGSRAIIVFQNTVQDLPEIGEVYVLTRESVGISEFFRIQDLEHKVETFRDLEGEYQLRVITITLSQPLENEFVGTAPNRQYQAASGATIIRKSIASDAGRYRSIVPLAAAAHIGDTSIKVESIFAQLIPSSVGEVPVVDAQPTGVVAQMKTRATKLNMAYQAWGTEALHYFETGLLMGSISIGPGLAHDQGLRIKADDGEFYSSQDSDFLHGRIWAGRAHLGSWPTQAYPAVWGGVNLSALSTGIPVRTNTRGYVYVQTLRPIPAPGSLVVSYRSQGRWYTLTDDGTGVLTGSLGTGSGRVDFQTGSVQVTLGALPDVGSSVIFNWGAPSHYEIRTELAEQKVKINFTLTQGNCSAGTLTIKYTSGGTVRNVTSNTSGVFSGAGTGTINHATGEVSLTPTYTPDPGTSILCTYTAGPTDQETFNPSKGGGGYVELQLTNYPLASGSLQLTYTNTSVGYRYRFTRTRVMRDNGSGGLLDEQGNVVAGASINYSTGLVVFPPDFNAYVPSEVRDDYANVVPGRVVSTATGMYEPEVGPSAKWIISVENQAKLVPWLDGTPVTVTYKGGSTVNTSTTDEPHPVNTVGMVVNLAPSVGNTIVPNSLLLSLDASGANNTSSVEYFYDRNGTMYRSMNRGNGSGTPCGSVDYTTGRVSITSWSAAGSGAPGASVFKVLACLTQVAPVPMSVIYGRTPGSPLRPGTFYIQATRFRDQAVISATADTNGNISSNEMHGVIDINSGVFTVAFGKYVLDSSLTADDKLEPWYSPTAVTADGYIWKPDEVVPGSITFNCVIEVAVPLDPDILKINPVRLPSDGRVPIIRKGDTLVIHNEQVQVLPNPLSAGQTVTLSRTGIQSVAVYDQNGLGVPDSKWFFTKGVDQVVFSNPLDLTGYVQPLVAIHTVEDMALCTDVQITGDISLGQALSHDYTSGDTYVSGALILGDAQARYSTLFSQNTWTNVWSDGLIGSAPTSGAKYNDATYPLVLKNKDTITQRWALVFTSSTAFNIVGEELGVIGTGTISAGAAPQNPATLAPYFTISPSGFGTGWATGNVLRFNTQAAGAPVWTARTVLSGPASNQDDLARIQVRWDKD